MDQDRRGGELEEDAPDDGLHFRGKNEHNTMLQQDVNGAERDGEILQEFSIVPNASKE